MTRALTRKEFLSLGLGLVGAGTALVLGGCGGDDGDDGETGGGPGGSGSGDDGSGDGSPTTAAQDDDGSGPGDASGSSDGGPAETGSSGSGDTGVDDSTGPSADTGTGSGDTGSTSDGAAACDSLDIMIQTAHPHDLVVPAEDVAAGVEQTYTITGLHTHSLTLTPEHFAQLAAGRTIMVQSSVDVHSHMVTITCA